MPRLHHLLTILITTLTPLTLSQSQQLIPNNLPSCAQSCTVLQQGQTGCVPAGGAPQSSNYQSCFCQSALLTQLYSNQPVQLCSNCNAGDMATIQNWYQTYCGKGGSQVAAPNSGNGQQNSGGQTQTQQGQQQTTPTVQATTDPTTSAGPNTEAGQNVNGVSVANQDASKGPWWSTHWKWVLMLIILVLGLTAIAVGGWFLHRRYHRRREAKWALGPGSQPDINTWGPGQSVHDLGYGAGAAAAGGAAAGGHRGGGDAEKGKMREGASEVRPPKKSRRIGRKRESGGLF